jgi:hypothetical protein
MSVVKIVSQRELVGFDQKGKWPGIEVRLSPVADVEPPAPQAGPNPFVVLKRNVVTPYLSSGYFSRGRRYRKVY